MEHLAHLSLDIPVSTSPRVIIIGGGFAGIQFAKGLKNSNYQVVMFDKNNYHTFQPLLYQVATAGLEPDSIAGALRPLFEHHKEFFFRMIRVTGIDVVTKTVKTLVGEINYDYLVLANGSKTNYFGNQALKENTFPLKQIPQALDLRSQILQNFEQSVMVRDEIEKDALTNFVVVGGGPTGVEVSGALGELKKHVLPNDYPEIDFNIMKLHLVDAGPRLLSAMSKKSGEKAFKYLKKFDVNVKLNTFVKDYDGRKVVLSDGSEILARTVIWAAGVKGNLIEGIPKSSIERGRVLVDPFNKILGAEAAFAIGDVSIMASTSNPNGDPMVAQVAIQQGKLLAKNFVNTQHKNPWNSFHYKDKGSMATIGRNKAVVDLPKFHFGGLFAWFVWMFIHLISIIGFRNRLVVFSNWVWNYLTFDRGTRLIIRRFVKHKKPQTKIPN